ncbi:hypothetical protein BY458DRAFT_519104 [Sporodiniella umbellata]|nr:hypothetical protein BY458DRAFT_519104 [Sporodiniella umbellata]
MTVQVRSKRRILPKRSVVDVDFVSPSQHSLQELLCTTTQLPSKQEYSVITELFGTHNKPIRETLPPIAIGKSTRSCLVKSDKIDGSEELIKGYLLPEPSRDSTPQGEVGSESKNEPIENRVESQEGLETQSTDRLPLIDSKDQTVEHGTVSIDRSAESLEDISPDTTPAVTEITRTKDDPKQDGSTKRCDQEKMVKKLKKQDNRKHAGRERRMTKTSKRRSCECEASFMVPPKKFPKHANPHTMLKVLKQSKCVNWVVNGADQDPRKLLIQESRRKKLYTRLHQPFIKKRVIYDKHAWLIKQQPIGALHQL